MCEWEREAVVKSARRTPPTQKLAFHLHSIIPSDCILSAAIDEVANGPQSIVDRDHNGASRVGNELPIVEIPTRIALIRMMETSSL